MAHVQSASESSYSTGSTGDLQLTSVVAGNCLLAITRVVSNSSAVISAVASNVDGAFTKLTAIDGGSAKARAEVWYLENASAGTHTITYTTVGTGQTVRWAVAEYDAVAASGIVDDYAEGIFTTTTTPSTANVTTTGTDRVIVSVIATDASATSIAAAGGETERQEVNERFQFQDEAAATAGDYSASWTLGATQPGVYIAFALKSGSVKYLKLLASSSAASAASVEGVVLNAARDTVIGEFTGQAFETSLEGSPGEAVLLIPVADITPDGSTLTTSDTPIVFAYNATDGTVGEGSATVVEV